MTNTEIQQSGSVTDTKFIEQYYAYVRRKEKWFIKLLGYCRPGLACNILYGEYKRLHQKKPVSKYSGRPKKIK